MIPRHFSSIFSVFSGHKHQRGGGRLLKPFLWRAKGATLIRNVQLRSHAVGVPSRICNSQCAIMDDFSSKNLLLKAFPLRGRCQPQADGGGVDATVVARGEHFSNARCHGYAVTDEVESKESITFHSKKYIISTSPPPIGGASPQGEAFNAPKALL